MFVVGNIDATVIAQRPKLAGFIPTMVENVARVLMVDPSQVNIKATTEEHLGFTGEGLGISASAVCLLESMEEAAGLVATNQERGCAGCSGCPNK